MSEWDVSDEPMILNGGGYAANTAAIGVTFATSYRMRTLRIRFPAASVGSAVIFLDVIVAAVLCLLHFLFLKDSDKTPVFTSYE